MDNINYNATITVNKTLEEAFICINNVSKWWKEDLEGNSENLNDVFTNRNGEVFVTHKIIEFVPNKKVVWLVTDCNLPFLKNKSEWKNTKMSFEISSIDNKTQISFTHVGLVPELECYNMCVPGWDKYIKESLFNLITDGVGQPEKVMSAK